MNEHIEYQTINEGGVPRYAVVAYDDFRRLLAAMDGIEPTIPHAVVSATVDGVSPLRAWREYLRLSQKEVAERMTITQSAYSQMEAGAEHLRKNTRERAAKALGLTVDQLDF